MRIPILSLLIAIVTLAGGPLRGEEALGPIRVGIVGDSTVADYEKKSPFRGWGQMLPEYFQPEAQFFNRAVSGRSSKSFVDQGLFKKALALKLDYLFIQFGHNDRARQDPKRYSDPKNTYPANLKEMISEARQAGAKPILVTPPSPRTFNPAAEGMLYSNLLPYAEAMKKVGEEEGVPVIDLHTPSLELFRKLGPGESARYAPTQGDINHFNEEGARVLAKMIVDALPKAVPELAAYLKTPAEK